MTPGYKYAMLCNGDCSYPPNYARTIIDRMESCPDIAIASGRISGGSMWGLAADSSGNNSFTTIMMVGGQRLWDMRPRYCIEPGIVVTG